MSIKKFNESVGAYEETSIPKIYKDGAWVESVGRLYNGSSDAWEDTAWGGSISYTKLLELSGLSPIGYSSLDDVFADQVACRQVFTKHSSSDYFVECCLDEKNGANLVDTFVSSDYAMKWIGLRDYICDKLMSYPDIQQKMLASQYWERILKDHVPTMTSNTAPYGKAFTSGTVDVSHDVYNAFDGNSSTWTNIINTTSVSYGYKFTNPVKIRRVYINRTLSGSNDKTKIQYSDDNINWIDATTEITNTSKLYYVDINDIGYHLYWRAFFTSGVSNSFGVQNLQFYGRSLNVSVPTMTSNTSPYGEASASSVHDTIEQPYTTFDKVVGKSSTSGSYGWASLNTDTSPWIQFDFKSYVCIKVLQLSSVIVSSTNDNEMKNFTISASNDGINYEYITSTLTFAESVNVAYNKFYDINPLSKSYRYWRINPINNVGSNKVIRIMEANFFGVDYSEREDRTYIYDHGVELMKMLYGAPSGDTLINTGEMIYAEKCVTSNNDINVYGYTRNSIYELDLSLYKSSNIVWGDKLIKTKTNTAPFWNNAWNGTSNLASKSFNNLPQNDVPFGWSLDLSNVNENCGINIGLSQASNIGDCWSVLEWWLE